MVVSSRPINALPPRGRYECIQSICVHGRALVQEFLDDLGDPDFAEFHASFDKLVDNALLARMPWRQMGQWFKPLRNVNNIWQLSSTSHRLLGFRDGTRLILARGFYKTGGETPKAEIRRAQELQRLYRRP